MEPVSAHRRNGPQDAFNVPEPVTGKVVRAKQKISTEKAIDPARPYRDPIAALLRPYRGPSAALLRPQRGSSASGKRRGDPSGRADRGWPDPQRRVGEQAGRRARQRRDRATVGGGTGNGARCPTNRHGECLGAGGRVSRGRRRTVGVWRWCRSQRLPAPSLGCSSSKGTRA